MLNEIEQNVTQPIKSPQTYTFCGDFALIYNNEKGSTAYSVADGYVALQYVLTREHTGQ